MPVDRLPTVSRGGPYYRVCKPDWRDCADSSFSKSVGGRFNPRGEFGALYLNATLAVAAAQAREQHAHRAIALFDLKPERRPSLAFFEVSPLRVVDMVDARSIAALHLPAGYPIDVGWDACQQVARRAFGAGLGGVAARSAAEARLDSSVGEELAYFDSQPPLTALKNVRFAKWYPDPYPLS